MKKKRDRYFEISFSLHRSKKRKFKSNLGGESGGGRDVFWALVALGIGVFTYAFVMFQFETTIAAIPFFAGLMTLGGYESYDQTVILSTLIFLIGGIAAVMVFDN